MVVLERNSKDCDQSILAWLLRRFVCCWCHHSDDEPYDPGTTKIEFSPSERREAYQFIQQQRSEYMKLKKKQWEENPPKPDSHEYNEMKRTIESDIPYEGCSGGAVSYIIAPTTLGVAKRVRYNLTNNELDLTNYDEWYIKYAQLFNNLLLYKRRVAHT